LELTEKQRKRIADVLTDTGKIVFTAPVVAPFFQNAPVKPWLVIAGVVTAVALICHRSFLRPVKEWVYV
jgi:hypothetical protein